MCGIVAAVGSDNVLPILMEGLKRLEYRGYDSAGVALVEAPGKLGRAREVGKVAALERLLATSPLTGMAGVAHTRWATHGEPSQDNAHPHVSGRVAVVHNGIIENHQTLKAELMADGYVFTSATDTEVVAHLVERELKVRGELLAAVDAVVARLEGAYALGVIDADRPDRVVGARHGSPLVVGIAEQGCYLGSDPLALLTVTDRFIYLEDGDLVEVTRAGCVVHELDAAGRRQPVVREVLRYEHDDMVAGKGEFEHYMLKEIHEQPVAVANALEGRLGSDRVLVEAFGPRARALLGEARQIHLVACGTSYHAAMVARYWIESLAGVPCQVEIASEYRYRDVATPPGTLLLTLSQSGETADTLAALRHARKQRPDRYIGALSICNVPGSSLVRESDLSLMTHAGPEIGVASTKAFTTQLTALMLVALGLRQLRGGDEELTARVVHHLRYLPTLLGDTLKLEGEIASLAKRFCDYRHTLFLGRGAQMPIAMEGALKLKEISYIHAEAYAAGELKHGPLALIDASMPVVALAPKDELLEKLKSNLAEVRARGGQLLVFADPESGLEQGDGMTVVKVPGCCRFLAPIAYTVPLQLLAYHVAVARGTDVDQPRNLAKSVTVE
ncbi:glutamine--fructose-6-phosphate transaminase (isomerizing) [Halomonas daqingensis]|uniref:Glutamine--fructose-6-phosphate aminotransferase [isomerizing] n=2 Tax=Billgrantia desiderata TaxID=52021 RepID=A0ABS9B0X2_9GAMM|nr:glutamine--fructose-6-phosphate transaminase (isomerizing) [Halomonas desiderata]MCE8027176.1 glutamine--fructose-6-phosphate transaminase (isomerizing) [Halomonas desiderata]MCE8040844.1 glutamine--fructose-6-phosphate transaminase (isomerizing) [Halomonas desiderata]MCE8045419.1 glutamine--fructose-6-phosphate transaminase (isomerizing) [Halomonas desiderata]OUE38256.1 glutamine--fructose-6-phosphate transaminase (isomerizing) [Halomonas desiderata SP1]